jgi:hypothetical protein
VFQSEADEKISVRITPPTPGFSSGVGCLVGRGWGEGVADNGNQIMVGEGAGGVIVANKIF